MAIRGIVGLLQGASAAFHALYRDTALSALGWHNQTGEAPLARFWLALDKRGNPLPAHGHRGRPRADALAIVQQPQAVCQGLGRGARLRLAGSLAPDEQDEQILVLPAHPLAANGSLVAKPAAVSHTREGSQLVHAADASAA
jgi:hypothetical protein